jgi:hypothetical protein
MQDKNCSTMSFASVQTPIILFTPSTGTENSLIGNGGPGSRSPRISSLSLFICIANGTKGETSNIDFISPDSDKE